MNLVLFCRLEDGLRAVGVLDAIREHPLLMREVFVGGEKPLTAEQLLGLFEIVSSPHGSNRRREENRTIMFRRDWLVEVAGVLYM